MNADVAIAIGRRRAWAVPLGLTRIRIPMAAAIALLALCTVAVLVQENTHWLHDRNGRWFRGETWPLIGYVVAEAPCYVWLRLDDNRWAWSAAAQPVYRPKVDICTDWREPWNK